MWTALSEEKATTRGVTPNGHPRENEVTTHRSDGFNFAHPKDNQVAHANDQNLNGMKLIELENTVEKWKTVNNLMK